MSEYVGVATVLLSLGYLLFLAGIVWFAYKIFLPSIKRAENYALEEEFEAMMLYKFLEKKKPNFKDDLQDFIGFKESYYKSKGLREKAMDEYIGEQKKK